MCDHAVDFDYNMLGQATKNHLKEILDKIEIQSKDVLVYPGTLPECHKYFIESDLSNALKLPPTFSNAADLLNTRAFQIPFLGHNGWTWYPDNYDEKTDQFVFFVINDDNEIIEHEIAVDTFFEVVNTAPFDHSAIFLALTRCIIPFEKFTLLLKPPEYFFDLQGYINILEGIEPIDHLTEDQAQQEREQYIFILNAINDFLTKNVVNPLVHDMTANMVSALQARNQTLRNKLDEQTIGVKEVSNGYTW